MTSYLHSYDNYQSDPANYNAVKIRINNPTVTVPENTNPALYNNYKAVDVEVNNPSVIIKKDPTYNYPIANDFVTAEYAIPRNYNLPDITPIAIAQLTNLVNNKTLINAELELSKVPALNSTVTEHFVIIEEEPDSAEIISIEESAEDSVKKDEATQILVPEPNLTTTEAEKKHNVTFNGKNQKVEIVPPVDIKPEVNVIKVVTNLKSQNYDIQAQQMEEIAKNAAMDDKKALPYIVTEIFSSLIDIVQKDTSELTGPSSEQIDARRKIIINELVKQQTLEKNPDAKDIELPHTISDKELKLAMELSPLEQAERNKEYGLYTMAILAKAYTNEVEKITGNVMPLTDLPGVSGIVDTLRFNQNPAVKVAAIDALRYIKRDEYKEELASVFELVAKDPNPQVSEVAKMALASLK
ncbi:hypothetical protein IJD34_09050 [bacterium]|nr:hypothetical protein [bacterium]